MFNNLKVSKAHPGCSSAQVLFKCIAIKYQRKFFLDVMLRFNISNASEWYSMSRSDSGENFQGIDPVDTVDSAFE